MPFTFTFLSMIAILQSQSVFIFICYDL